MNILSKVTDFVLPPRCICGKKIVAESNSICAPCYDDSGMVTSSFCSRCGNPQEFDFGKNVICGECISNEPEFDQARFVFKYNELTARIVTRLKYGDKTQSVKKIAEFMSSRISGFDNKPDIITSIPISKKKLLHRKFNQSAYIANHISRKVNIEIDNQILKRVKDVPPQASLKRAERLKNVKGVFAIDPKKADMVKGRTVLLIDDVITTGATITEATKVLKKAGAEKVYVLSFAKTLMDN